MKKIKVGVVGVGYFGQFHVEKYAKMRGVELVGVADVNPARATEIARRYRTQPFPHHTELLERVQAVTIAVPTPLHHAVAKDFLLRGADVLLEKPISTTLEEADELIQLAESKDLILQIGHQERFNGAMLALAGMVQDPVYIESNRLGPFLMRGTEVDVVLDLMIHDLDIILSWVQSKVKWVHPVGIPVLTPHIDIANVRVEFDNGCTANLTASRVSRERMRKIRLFQPKGYLSIDLLSQKVSSAVKEEAEGGKVPKIIIRKVPVKKVDPLKMEMESFLQSVRDRRPPKVTGGVGKQALDVGLQIVQGIKELIKKRGSQGSIKG